MVSCPVRSIRCVKRLKKKIFCWIKEKDEIGQNLALEFLTQCYEGGKTEDFDKIYEKAGNKTDAIFTAKDFSGDEPFQKAAKFGNADALEWILAKWKQHEKYIDLNKVDSAGFTAVMHCCYKGYTNCQGESAARIAKTKDKRLRCVKALLQFKQEVEPPRKGCCP